LEFGEYGNIDSKGPGSLVHTADVPMAWPTGVACTDNYIYFTDMINTRLTQVKRNYALNRLPNCMTSSALAADNSMPLQLTAAPNPFTSRSLISLSLPKKSAVKVAVYDLSGRLIKSIAQTDLKTGIHNFTWDGTDARGAGVAAGIYMCRASADNRIVLKKIILSK
jgi:flagellar hook assembly protein FlgD